MANTFFSDLSGAFTYSFKEPWFFTDYGFLLTLSVFLIGYAIFRPDSKLKSIYLILFSLFFYYKSSGPFLLLFLLVIVCDYFLSRAIYRLSGIKKNLLLIFSIGYSISFLLYFKYSNFFIDNINYWFTSDFKTNDLFLPIGISFYTFQSVSYILDVSKKEIKPSENIIDYTFYMTFFPHLVAGPIVRAKDFLPQIPNPLHINSEILKEAVFKISVGLAKKLLIADYLAKYVDMLHAAPDGFSGFEHWIAMYSYAFQIYFDFSGYSDIAIGIALLLGYRLKENFQNPYVAQNITSFWRRWHISLSLWLRDYIYIPLGGNRKGVFLTYLFLFLTMLIGGFWHGADWKFIFWGVSHGMLLIVHKLISKIYKWEYPPIKILHIFITFHFVSFLWLFFRSENIFLAFESIKRIIISNNFMEFWSFYSARPEVIFMLFASALIVFSPEVLKQKLINRILSLPLILWPFILLVILQVILQFRDDSIQPFIYFQF
ncbi:MAG: hypothetical protein RL365_293 [Bacteroidota bacterium]|jgi:D-alanyl-lipoteichoic acid acyltransferase DltB (MBOAT superfamily)